MTRIALTGKAVATFAWRAILVAALFTLVSIVTVGLGLAQPAPSPTATPSTAAPPPPLPLPPSDGCDPGSVLPACHSPVDPSASQSPGPPESCSGPGCLPRPDTPGGNDSETSPPQNPPPAEHESPCGITNISGCVRGAIESFIRSLVAPALDGLLGLLSSTVLTTPPLMALPHLQALWQSSWRILVGSYGTIVVIAGTVVMTHESLQTRTTIKETLPRLVIGFLAGTLSLWVGSKAIELTNALARAVSSEGIDQHNATTMLTTLAVDSQHGGLFLLFLGLILALMVGAVVLTYIVRVSLTVVLLVGAPLMLMCHAMPQTEGIARWWWKAFGGCLAIQVAQSLTLVTAMRVFLTPDGFSILFPDAAGFINVLVALGLMYILFKIPFWILGSIRGGSGRSFVGSLVKGVIATKAFGLLRGAGAATGSSKSGRGVKRGTSAVTETPDPYASPRSTSDGQYLLPLSGLKRGRAPKPPHQRYAPKPTRQDRFARGSRQLKLPMDGEWPENKPRMGRDGQYRLPLDVQHQTKPTTSVEPTTPPRSSLQGRSRQMRLPADGEWPENRPKLGPDGQYRLPIQAQRVRKPVSPPTSSAPSQPPLRGRQQKLPADGEWPENKPKLGPDGQYRLPLKVQRTRKPPPNSPPSPAGHTSGTRTPHSRQQPLPLHLPKTRPPRPNTPRQGEDQ